MTDLFDGQDLAHGMLWEYLPDQRLAGEVLVLSTKVKKGVSTQVGSCKSCFI